MYLNLLSTKKLKENLHYNVIKYFVWADKRDKMCFIFHKVRNRVLYGIYSYAENTVITYCHYCSAILKVTTVTNRFQAINCLSVKTGILHGALSYACVSKITYH